MIFSAPRFAVIDDKEAHLAAIVSSIEALGSSCIGMHFREDEPDFGIDSNLLRGVRCLFMDMHLVSGTTIDIACATIASLLQNNISSECGLYLLVVWTEDPDVIVALQTYLDNPDTFPMDKIYTKPIAVLGLSKNDFINTQTGAPHSPQNLQVKIRECLSSVAPFAALLAWESEVLAAAGELLSALTSLISDTDKTNSNFSPALNLLLSRLVCDAIGQPNVAVDHRAALHKSLFPMFSDRIIKSRAQTSPQGFWVNALSKSAGKLPQLPEKTVGRINSMLHLATPAHETIRPTDWGAVSKWPFKFSGKTLTKRTGLTKTAMFCDEFGLTSADISKCTPVLIRIGAACDYAQGKLDGNTFLFATLMPYGLKKTKKLSDSIWVSPVFSDAAGASFELYAHMRYPMTFSQGQCIQFRPMYRLREQLITHLITAASHYAARPGIISLRPK